MSAGATPGRPPGRKFAEGVTLALSALVVAGVAGFLVYEAIRGDPPAVPISVRVLSDQAREHEGGYVVPIEVRNNGRKTLKDVKVLVTRRPPGGEPQSHDFLIDYLPERSSQTIYLTLDRSPSDLRLEAKPFSYQLE